MAHEASEPGPSGQGRDQAGRFAKGNQAGALHHGVYAEQRSAAQAAWMAEHRARLVEDLGGEDHLSVVQCDLVDQFVQTLADLRAIDAYNQEHQGPLTPRGAVRASTKLRLVLLSRLERLAKSIGLKKSRRTGPTLEQYIAGKRAQQS